MNTPAIHDETSPLLFHSFVLRTGWGLPGGVQKLAEVELDVTFGPPRVVVGDVGINSCTTQIVAGDTPDEDIDHSGSI